METKITKIRYSKKREALLHELQETHCHPSAEWLFQRLKPTYPDLSLGTVYRNLAFFQEQGEIRSVGVVNGQERFDADTSNHCHFYCENCGAIEDLHGVALEEAFEEKIARDYDISISRHELNLHGICGVCQHGGEKETYL